ncbi:MAG TPA: hypothetical protein VFN23_18500 [Ktedonobacteraceae bacterium]|nr:hypothetical protein [Ktedonobacteraceae bacterium]
MSDKYITQHFDQAQAALNQARQALENGETPESAAKAQEALVQLQAEANALLQFVQSSRETIYQTKPHYHVIHEQQQ